MRDSYSNPPEEPDVPKEAEEVRMILEEAGIPEDLITRVDKIVMELAYKASQDCPVCERQAAKAEAEAERAWQEWQNSEDAMLPALCPHDLDWMECQACAIAGDLAYDAARERAS